MLSSQFNLHIVKFKENLTRVLNDLETPSTNVDTEDYDEAK